MECSCRLWPTPGMYVVTSIPLVSRTRATFRSAEFGFLGVDVYTHVHTPRFCGHPCKAGLAVFHRGGLRPLRTSWLNVGTNLPQRECVKKKTRTGHIPPRLAAGTSGCERSDSESRPG